MKSKLGKIFIGSFLLLIVGFGVVLTTVNADSVYDSQTEAIALSEDIEYSLEEMLIYAIQDEYLAKAEYELIISEYGEVRPFIHIVEAEQTHIDLLVPLFEAYGYDLPENNASELVVLPDSITSAIATGVEAEEANIAMYQVFLAQDNLPEDVREVFEYLLNASQHHLAAFSKDRYSYVGEDMMQRIRHMFQNREKGSENARQNKQSGQGTSQQRRSNYQGYNGECPLDE